MDGEHVRVLVVDDQDLFRGVLCDLVAATDGFLLVGSAHSGEAALDLAAELAPRLVIMDCQMPGMDGVDTARALTSRHPGVVVLLVSVQEIGPELIARSTAAEFMTKQQLSPRRLSEVWARHGS